MSCVAHLCSVQVIFLGYIRVQYLWMKCCLLDNSIVWEIKFAFLNFLFTKF